MRTSSFAGTQFLGAHMQSRLSHLVVVDDHVNKSTAMSGAISITDAAVCTCLLPCSRQAIEAAMIVPHSRAALIGITNAQRGHLAEVADISLVVGASSEFFGDSPTAVMSVVHASATFVAPRTRGGRRRVERHEQLSSIDCFCDFPDDVE